MKHRQRKGHLKYSSLFKDVGELFKSNSKNSDRIQIPRVLHQNVLACAPGVRPSKCFRANSGRIKKASLQCFNKMHDCCANEQLNCRKSFHGLCLGTLLKSSLLELVIWLNDGIHLPYRLKLTENNSFKSLSVSRKPPTKCKWIQGTFHEH